GFAVVLYEEVYDSSTPSASEGYLLRFDKEGSLLWKTSLQQSGIPEITMMDCIEYENYLVAAEDLSFGTEQVWKYDWFDLNTGTLIKRTEQPMPDGITNYSSDFVILDSGLWIQRNLRQNKKDDRLAELNSRDEVLIRVPER
ncbi:MAG: hypothetical protein J6K72_02745, partial [Clostridia bacterium]|nr:hypothetical protein [Clostridia bacterium]